MDKNDGWLSFSRLDCIFLGIGIYVLRFKYVDVFDLIINAECLERYAQARTILSNKPGRFKTLKDIFSSSLSLPLRKLRFPHIRLKEEGASSHTPALIVAHITY